MSNKNQSMKRLMTGVFFLLLWAAGQRISTVPLLEAIARIPESMDNSALLTVTSFVVLLNGLQAITLYLGWFLTGSGVASFRPSFSPLSWLLPATAIPLSSFLLPALGEGFQLHFGIPAVLDVSSVLVLHHLTRNIFDWIYKSIALALFVFSFQWLDIIPLLTPYGGGWSELSASVKTAAQILGRGWLLNWAGGLVFAVLFFSGMIVTKLMVRYSARMSRLVLFQDKDQEITRPREETLSNGSIMEMQYLVHDLKRPLTTIMGLADVIVSGKGGESVKKYGAVIAEAGRSMEEMISEILHEDFRRSISLGDLLEYVFTQISSFPWRENVVFAADKGVRNETVTVNVVRFSRAVVNLLDNAQRANFQSGGKRITIALSLKGENAEIAVSDQGRGFPEDWTTGSGWNSTGLGLQYVTMVVRNHGGIFSVENLPEGGARMAIFLRRNDEKGG